MFDTIAPRYDLVNRLMTLGLDLRWRRETVARCKVPPGSTVVDLACGTGDFSRLLVSIGHATVGVDFSIGMLTASKNGSLPLVQGDGVALPLRSGCADAVVSGFALRNFADLPGVLSESARVLRPGGRIAILEVGRPRWRLVALGERIWFSQVVVRLGALLSDAASYRYLPKSVAYLPSPDELATLLEDAGFREVRQTELTGGLAQCVTATRTARTGAT